MKAATAVGVLVAVLALILAIVALAAAPEGAGEVKSEIAALRKELAGVPSRVEELGAGLKELNGRLDRAAGRISRLERAVTAAPEPAGEFDEDRVREILRDEMRAQMDRFRRGRGGQDTPEALRERVGLDEEKTEQVTQIRNKLREGIGNIWREGGDRGRDKNMELMRELQKKAEEEIAKLLTPEEMEKYREMNRGGRGGRGRRGGGRGDREEGRPAREEGAGDAAF